MGVRQERGHSTEVWWGQTSQLALEGELCGVRRTWLGGCCSGKTPSAGSRGLRLAAEEGQRVCRMLPSSRGLWTPVGGYECWRRVRRWLGTCPGPGGKQVPWHLGWRRRFCPLPVPSQSPAGAAPCCRVYPACTDSSPRSVLQGMGTSQPFPCSPGPPQPPGWWRGGAGCVWGGGARQGTWFWGDGCPRIAVFVDLWVREGTSVLGEGEGQSWRGGWWFEGAQ